MNLKTAKKTVTEKVMRTGSIAQASAVLTEKEISKLWPPSGRTIYNPQTGTTLPRSHCTVIGYPRKNSVKIYIHG